MSHPSQKPPPASCACGAPDRAPSRACAFATLARAAAVAAAILAAAAWFVWATAEICRNASPDYAIVVTMARDMAHGRAFPVFFYGQAYMGSLEPAFSALLCALFGDDPFVVSLGAALLGLLAVLWLAALAWRLSGRCAALFALLLCVPGPYVWAHYLVSPRGGYALVALLVVAGLRIASASPVFADPESRRPRRGTFLAFGFVCGLAFWNDWLALPLLFGPAIVLAARTGLRILSPRAWGPGLAAFAAGSLPWWVWNARHGWASVAAGSGRPGGWNALLDAAGARFAAFVGEVEHAGAFWSTWFPWLLVAMAALSLAGLLLSDRRRRLLPAAAAAGIGLATFAAGYAATSFGSMDAPRYFAPLVPCAALFAALGLAELVRAPAFRRKAFRAAAALLAFAAVLACAGAETRLCVLRFREVRRLSGARLDGFLPWPALPGLDRPAFGEYGLFGANWATDERVCIVTPRGGRCQRYLDRLEAEEKPSVVENHAWFSDFLSATGGRAAFSQEGGVRIHRDAMPPPRADPCPREAVSVIKGPAGAACEDVLLDGNAATFRNDPAGAGGRVSYEIALSAPREVCGIDAACLRSGRARGWCAEAVGPDGSATLLAAEANHGGWFWSGPRFYLGGTDERWVLRWEPRTAERIRITFSGLRPGSSPRPAELRLLEPARTPAPDPEGLAAAVREIEAAAGPVRVFADRWLAGRLGPVPRDPSIDTEAIGAANYGRAFDARTRLDPGVRSLVVVPEALAAPTEAAFAEAGLAAEKTVRAGAALYLAGGPGRADDPRAAAFAAEGCLRFLWGRLVVDRPVPPPVAPERAVAASFFDGRLELVGCTAAPDALVRGGTGRLGFLFRVPSRERRPSGGWIVADFRKDGRTVFEAVCPLSRPDPMAGAPDLPDYDDRRFPFPVPDWAPPGDYTLAVGIRRDPGARRCVPVRPGPGVEAEGGFVALPWTVRID